MFMGGAFGIRQIYLSSKVVCFVLFCFVLFSHVEISQTMALHAALLIFFEKLSMSSMGASTWFETLWSSSVEVMDYLIILSMKNK
jgi:hypothetical protein